MADVNIRVTMPDGRTGEVDLGDPQHLIHLLDGRGHRVGGMSITTFPYKVGRHFVLRLMTEPDATVESLNGATLTDDEWAEAVAYLREHCNPDHPGFRSTPNSPSAAVAQACLTYIRASMPNLNIPA